MPKNKLVGQVVRWMLPLALTVVLVCYMFKKVNFSDMMDILRHGVDYWWILCAMGISVVSHVLRALRWRIQLRSLDIDAPLMALSCSVFGCYALNLVFPRLGEVWRCTYISRREHAPFTRVLGSMVADRLADAVCVLVLLVLTFIVAASAINSFLSMYPVGKGIVDIVSNPWTWCAIVMMGVLVFALLHYGGDLAPVKKVKGLIKELWHGFADVARMDGKWLFVLYSAGIWFCYFIQLYVAFFAFPFTKSLCADPGLAYGLTPCLVAFVLSSIGMAVPSNGGLGPWNIAIMFGLAIYGISAADGTAFSMLQWTGQTVMLIALGVFTMIYISFDKTKIDLIKHE